MIKHDARRLKPIFQSYAISYPQHHARRQIFDRGVYFSVFYAGQSYFNIYHLLLAIMFDWFIEGMNKILSSTIPSSLTQAL